jgi:hypothetical protein
MLRSSVTKRHPTIPYDDRFPISTENPLVSVDRQDPEQPFSPIPIEIPISGVQRTLPKFVPISVPNKPIKQAGAPDLA